MRQATEVADELLQKLDALTDHSDRRRVVAVALLNERFKSSCEAFDNYTAETEKRNAAHPPASGSWWRHPFG